MPVAGQLVLEPSGSTARNLCLVAAIVEDEVMVSFEKVGASRSGPWVVKWYQISCNSRPRQRNVTSAPCKVEMADCRSSRS